MWCAACADLSEIESDITPFRSHVAHVLEQTLGVYPDQINVETRYMVSDIHSTLSNEQVLGTMLSTILWCPAGPLHLYSWNPAMHVMSLLCDMFGGTLSLPQHYSSRSVPSGSNSGYVIGAST